VPHEFSYGPVEFLLVAFETVTPPRSVVDAVEELIEAGTIRLLDLVVVSRAPSGEVTAVDVEDVSEEYGFGSIELEATGLAPDDDIQELGADLAPGTSAVLLVVEHRWAKTLAERVASGGGYLIHTERIPAPLVNEQLAALGAER